MAKAMSPLTFIVLFAIATLVSGRKSGCSKVRPINFSLKNAYCDQPFFVNFLERTEDNQLIDNICETFFPLPDDPNTFQVYISKVYCDGSNEIASFIATDMDTGSAKFGSPFCTFSTTAFGYAGCDTYIIYRCFEYGDCGMVDGTTIFGFTTRCSAIGLSCLRKVEEIVTENGFCAEDYYVLPMKLPNRCVTQQLCLQPPNPFYNKLPGLVGRGYY